MEIQAKKRRLVVLLNPEAIKKAKKWAAEREIPTGHWISEAILEKAAIAEKADRAVA